MGRFDIAALLLNTFGAKAAPSIAPRSPAALCGTLYRPPRALQLLPETAERRYLQAATKSSDWGAKSLTKAQIDYAASDVLHLCHKLRDVLNQMFDPRRSDRARASVF